MRLSRSLSSVLASGAANGVGRDHAVKFAKLSKVEREEAVLAVLRNVMLRGGAVEDGVVSFVQSWRSRR